MNRLRLLMFGLLLLVLSGGGYFVLSQVRPSADTIVDPTLASCPETLLAPAPTPLPAQAIVDQAFAATEFMIEHAVRDEYAGSISQGITTESDIAELVAQRKAAASAGKDTTLKEAGQEARIYHYFASYPMYPLVNLNYTQQTEYQYPDSSVPLGMVPNAISAAQSLFSADRNQFFWTTLSSNFNVLPAALAQPGRAILSGPQSIEAGVPTEFTLEIPVPHTLAGLHSYYASRSNSGERSAELLALDELAQKILPRAGTPQMRVIDPETKESIETPRYDGQVVREPRRYTIQVTVDSQAPSTTFFLKYFVQLEDGTFDVAFHPVSVAGKTNKAFELDEPEDPFYFIRTDGNDHDYKPLQFPVRPFTTVEKAVYYLPSTLGYPVSNVETEQLEGFSPAGLWQGGTDSHRAPTVRPVEFTPNQSLGPITLRLRGTAKPLCASNGVGALGDEQETVFNYTTKVFTSDAAIQTGQTTELSIGLDGWTQLKAPEQRTKFKEYFADKEWRVTVIGRNADGEAYGFVPGFAFGTASQEQLTPGGAETGAATLPLRTADWTDEQAAQALKIQHDGKTPLPSELKLKLEIVDTQAVQEFPLGALAGGKLQFERKSDAKPAGIIDPDDEDEVTPADESEAEASQPAETTSWLGQARTQLASLSQEVIGSVLAQEDTNTPAPEPGPTPTGYPGESPDGTEDPDPGVREAVSGRLFDGEEVRAVFTIPAQDVDGEYKLKITAPLDFEFAEFNQPDGVGGGFDRIEVSEGVTVVRYSKEFLKETDEVVTIDLRASESVEDKFKVGVPLTVKLRKEGATQTPAGATVNAELEFAPSDGSKTRLIDIPDLEVELFPIGVSTLELVKAEFKDPITGEAKTQDRNAQEEPIEFTVYPGSTLTYQVRMPIFGDIDKFKEKPWTATAQLSKQVSQVYHPGDRTRLVEDAKGQHLELDWTMADAKIEGNEAVFEYMVLLKDEIPAGQSTIGTYFFVYDDHQRMILTAVKDDAPSNEGAVDPESTKAKRAPLFVQHPLWLAAQGNVKTALGKNLPYVSVAASKNALSYAYENEEKTLLHWLTPSEREKVARTRTDKDGNFVLRAPRKDFTFKEKEDTAEGASKEYQTQLFIEFLNDEYEYDYRYLIEDVIDMAGEPADGTFGTIPPLTIISVPVTAPQKSTWNQDFDFYESSTPFTQGAMSALILGDEKVLTENQRQRALGGTEAMYYLSRTKHEMEEIAKPLRPKGADHLMGEYVVNAWPNKSTMQQACGSDRAGACSNKYVMSIGPSVWELAKWTTKDSESRSTILHEWAHHFHNFVRENYITEGQNLAIPNDYLERIGMPRTETVSGHPNNHHAFRNNGSVAIFHQSFVNDRSEYAISEGFADFMATWLERYYGERDDWKIGAGDSNMSVPLPTFAGLANGPNQVGSQPAAPVVYVGESEEQAVKSFMKYAVAPETSYTAKTAWWAGFPESASYRYAPSGSSTNESLINLLKAMRSAGTFDKLIFSYGLETNQIDATDTPASALASPNEWYGRTLRLFGIFNDLNCNWRYDEYPGGLNELNQQSNPQGSYCPFVARDQYYLVKEYRRSEGTIGSYGGMGVMGARPWRDWPIAPKKTATLDETPFSHVADSQKAKEPFQASMRLESLSSLRINGIAAADEEQPARAKVTYSLPDEFGEAPIEREIEVGSAGVNVPLTPYPPVLNSRITVEILGANNPPFIMESADYWRSVLSETPTELSGTYSVTGDTPPISDEPIDIADSSAPPVDQSGEPVPYIDPNFQAPVDGEEPPAGINADNVVVTLKDPNGQDATTNLHIRYARVRAEGVETLSNETVVATGEFVHQLRFGSTGADEYLVITADGSDNRFFLTAARNEEVKVERGDDTGPRFGMPFLVNGQATPSPDEMLRLEQQRLFPAPTNQSGPTPEPYVDPNFQQPPPDGFQPAPVYASDTVVVRTETPEHNLASTTLHLQYARVTADRIEPLYETTFQSNGEFAHQLRFSSTDANEYLVITADGSDNRFFISGARNEEVRLERADAPGARFWTNFNVNGQQAPAIADLLRMEQQRFAAPPPVTIDGMRPLMPGECRVVNDMVTECALPSGDVVDGEEIVRLDLDADGNTAETPNEALNLPPDAFAPMPMPEGDVPESLDAPREPLQPADPGTISELLLKTVDPMTNEPTVADIQIRYVRWNRTDAPVVLREETVASTGATEHEIGFETKEPTEFLVATVGNSGSAFVLMAEQYANYQQRVIEGYFIPALFHEFHIGSGAPESLADILSEFEQRMSAHTSQPVDAALEQVVVVPLLQPYYDPAISLHDPCQDDGLDHEDELSEDDIPDDGGAIEEDACATVDGDKLYFTAGGFLTVATSEFIPGEVVDIQIDGELVAENQLIPADGAELMVALPDDLADGEHQVELERIDGTLVAGAFQVKNGLQLEWLLLVAGVLALVWLGLKLARRRLQGGGTPTISVSMTPQRPMAPGAMLLLLVAGILALQYSDIAQALSPVNYTMRSGEVYLMPGILHRGQDPASAPYRNSLYARESGVNTYDMWGTVGTVTLAQRFAGEWAKRHPEEIVVFNDMGLRGGGAFPPHEGAGHAEARAIDFWTIDRVTGLSRVINDPQNFPQDTALYSPELVAEVASLLYSLTGGQQKIYFKPKGGDAEAAALAKYRVEYDDGHGDHWHIEVPLNFQGPVPDRRGFGAPSQGSLPGSITLKTLSPTINVAAKTEPQIVAID